MKPQINYVTATKISLECYESLLVKLLKQELLIQAHLDHLNDFGVETSELFLDLGDIIMELFDLPLYHEDILSWFYDLVHDLTDQLRNGQSSLSELEMKFYIALKDKKRLENDYPYNH